MEALIVFAVVLVVTAALAIAALKWGVDSRDGSTDPRRPVTPTGIA